MPFFPVVPIAPGVPPVLRNPNFVPAVVSLLVADAVQALLGLLSPQWGIFQNGVRVLTPDTVATFGYRQGWNVSDYPLEQGAFESYDKVATPYESRVRMATGGNAGERGAFLTEVQAIANSLLLYDIVTPERVFSSANVTRFEMVRSPREGLGILVVDIFLVEMRITATQQFSNTKDASGASPQSAGLATPTTPTTQQLKAPLLAN